MWYFTPRKKDSNIRILAKGMKRARQHRHTKAPSAIIEDTPALSCYLETSDRSFKIFFRVPAAILLLKQSTLLNQELEGMLTYLNTFPDLPRYFD